jgi:hypothetical protein
MCMKYRVVYDNGKPYEETYNNTDELFEGLKKFYDNNKTDDYQYDAKVYDESGLDITESFVVESMIGEIVDNEIDG